MKGLIERELTPGAGTKQAIESLVQAHKLSPGGLLPWERYLMGTVFLSAVALIFAALTIYGSSQYRHYRSELTGCLESGVKQPDFHKTPRRLIVAMYMFFPGFDVLVRVFLPHV